MKTLRILCLAVIMLFLLAGCTEDEAIPYDYVILIGQNTVPDWQSISVGDQFGGDAFLQTYGNASFGLIHVIWDGVEEATFEKGGIMLSRNKGNLKLEGELTIGLKLILVSKLGEGSWKVLRKDELKAGSLSYRLNLQEEN